MKGQSELSFSRDADAMTAVRRALRPPSTLSSNDGRTSAARSSAARSSPKDASLKRRCSRGPCVHDPGIRYRPEGPGGDGVDARTEKLVALAVHAAEQLPGGQATTEEVDERGYALRSVVMIRVPESGPVGIHQIDRFPLPPGVLTRARGQALDEAAREAITAALTSQRLGRPSSAYLCRRGEAWAWFRLDLPDEGVSTS